MVNDVASLVHLTTLHQRSLAGMTPHRRRQRLASVQHVQSGHAEVQPARRQIAQQLADYAGILARSFAQAQHCFAPVDTDPQGHDHLSIPERRAIDQHRAQPQLAQRPLHQRLQLFPAGLDETVAHRRLLHPISFLEILYHCSIVVSRQPSHHLVPHRLPAALEQFVTAQPLLAMFRTTQPRSPNRYLLPVHYAVAVLFPPAVGATLRVLLMALPR